jgi:hypothetical protein
MLIANASTIPWPRPAPLAALRRAWRTNRPLALVGVMMLLTLAATLVGLVVDDRVITGAPAWMKPAKFAISLAIYSFTLLWLLTFVEGHRRWVALVSWGTAIAFVVEMIAIVGQVVRGTSSHFNMATPFDAAVWGTMGTAIMVFWLLSLVTAVLLLRQRLPEPAFAWGLRLGILVTAVGMALAFLMTRPTPAQEAAAAAGQGMPIVGAHAVGVEDGGAGLPVVGWSTEGGDLRAAHFVGLHAMQVVPLLGWIVASWRAPWLRARDRVALVWVAGLGYLGLTLLLAWQALRGQPLVAPDALTLGVLAALVAAACGAALAVLLRARATAAGGWSAMVEDRPAA